jgi:hypothetical protein
LRFDLYGSFTGGTPIGPQIDHGDVLVAGGLFTVILDFDTLPFFAHRRWLEIGVRPGASTGPYTILTPRQELTPVPFALAATKVGWTGIAGTPAGFADNVDNDALGALACANGQVPKWGGSGFACAADAVGWSLTGNAGTNPATSFLGTMDMVPLELRAGNERALRLEPAFGGTSTLVGGFSGNSAAPGVRGGTVGGGGEVGQPNRVTDNFGTVAGGRNSRGPGQPLRNNASKAERAWPADAPLPPGRPMADVCRYSKNSQKLALDFSGHHSAWGSRHWLLAPGSWNRQFRQHFRSEWQCGQPSVRCSSARSWTSRLQWWQTFTWPPRTP